MSVVLGGGAVEEEADVSIVLGGGAVKEADVSVVLGGGALEEAGDDALRTPSRKEEAWALVPLAVMP